MERKYQEKIRRGDEIQEAMLESAGGVVDTQKTVETLESAFDALRKQAEALKGLDYTSDLKVKCPECETSIVARVAASAKEVAQAMSYTGRVIDDIYRLKEFAAGRADSRTELGVGGLLEFLTDEQMSQLGLWIEAGKASRVERKPKGAMLQ